jgi:glycosyltransferase involved in cell wall biosynthesis
MPAYGSDPRDDPQHPSRPPAGRPVELEIVIPARNEASRLPDGLRELCAALAGLPLSSSVIVVDNGSTDGTADLVREWPSGPVPIRLLSCSERGKGAAVRTGVLATRAPLVGFMDADMATTLDVLGRVIALLIAGHVVVVGSRAHPCSEVEARHNVMRHFGAAAFRATVRRVLPGIGDTQCGFKFFDGEVARRAALDLRIHGFAFDVELLARCRTLGAVTTEIPIEWHDKPGSTFHPGRHALGCLRDVLRIWWTVGRIVREPRGSRSRVPCPSCETLGAELRPTLANLLTATMTEPIITGS